MPKNKKLSYINQLKVTFAIIFVASLVFTLLSWALTRATINSSATGFFTFYPGVLDIGTFLLLLVLGVLAVTGLKRFLKIKWLESFAVSLPGLLFIGSISLCGATNTLFPVPSSVYSWLGGNLWLFVMTLVLMLVSLIVSYFIIQKTRKSKNKYAGLIICAVLGVILVGVVLVISGIQTTNDIKGIFTKTSPNQSEANQNAEDLDFNVYQPSYTLSGYVANVGVGSGPVIYGSIDSFPFSVGFAFEDLQRSVDGGYDSYVMYNYKLLPSFNPPATCGPDEGSDIINNCKPIGNSSLGCTVYYAQDISYDYEAYCKLGTTVINTDIYGPMVAGQSENSQAQINQILDLYNSLQLISKQAVLSNN